jgi:RNA polymerase sigma-70 factor, ECF subfamily
VLSLCRTVRATGTRRTEQRYGAVAIAMVDGPEVGLPLIDAIAETGTLDDYYLLHATRADLLRRAGRTSEASASYRAALALAPTNAEWNFIASRLQGG